MPLEGNQPQPLPDALPCQRVWLAARSTRLLLCRLQALEVQAAVLERAEAAEPGAAGSLEEARVVLERLEEVRGALQGGARGDASPAPASALSG